MAEPLTQECSWPGVAAVESLTATVSHGVSPGAFVLTTYPQAAAPEPFGTLTVGDGARAVAFRDCRVESLTGKVDAGGQTYTLVIQDRRWRWKTGAVSGAYNVLDPRGKLVPWWVRSPEELARLCLEAMGERDFLIDLPPGLTEADGAAFQEYLAAGENFPQTLANPPVAWDRTPPAEALARLCDYYGRRVVYQPVADRVVIAPLGAGRALPADPPCESVTPALERAAVPAAVAVAGAPVRVQCRLPLEPVGEEWDGSYRPVHDLSYAPLDAGGKLQQVRVSCSGPGTGLFLQVHISSPRDWRGTGAADRERLRNDFSAGPAGDADSKVPVLATDISTAEIGTRITATTADADQTLVLTAKERGFFFEVEALVSGLPHPNWTATLARAPAPPGTGWESAILPGLFSVRPTDRLAYPEALARARKSVFRCYRVKAPSGDKESQPELPLVGRVFPRRQLVLQKSLVEQVEPEPRKRGRVDRGSPVPPGLQLLAGGALPEFYNGYSRDRAPVVYGAVSRRLGTVLWDGRDGWLNTDPGDEVTVPFSIDEREQLVVFAEPVYEDCPLAGSANMIKFPALVLETAVLVRELKSGNFVRWEQSLPLGGSAPVHWQVREDVAVGVIGRYDAKHKLTHFAYGTGDRRDAAARAAHYLAGAARAYELTGGETRQYIGILPIDPDGLVQQVTWSVGGAGATTVASSNTEHAVAVPPYAARRRAENLPPEAAAAEANAREGRWLDLLPPKEAP